MAAEMMSPSLMIRGLAGGAALHGSGVTVDNGWVGVGCSPGQGRRARCQGTLGDQGHLTDRKEKGKKKTSQTEKKRQKERKKEKFSEH